MMNVSEDRTVRIEMDGKTADAIRAWLDWSCEAWQSAVAAGDEAANKLRHDPAFLLLNKLNA